jgi:hypothetical protein
MESAFASSAASERFQCVISTGIGAGEISRIAVSDNEGMKESNADYRSVSGLLQQPPPSALPSAGDLGMQQNPNGNSRGCKPLNE